MPLRSIFDVASKETRLAELDPKLNDPNLWNNPEQAKIITQEATRLKAVLDSYFGLKENIESLEELFELATEEDLADLEAEKQEIQKILDLLYNEVLFSGDHDDKAAIITIKPWGRWY